MNPQQTPPAAAQPDNQPPIIATPDTGPLEFGTPQPTTQPPAPADDVPKWAKDFMGSIDERFTNLESTLQEEITEPTADPNAPVGAPASQTPASELEQMQPRGWADVEKFVNEKINQGVQQGIEGFQAGLQQQNTQEQAAQARVDKELDDAVDSLESKGLIPPVQNPNDRNDAGRAARRELYGAAAKLGTTNLEQVYNLTLAPLHAQGKMYDPVTDSLLDYPTQPGAAAPIGSSTATTGQQSNLPSYKDIHAARSFTELRERAGL